MDIKTLLVAALLEVTHGKNAGIKHGGVVDHLLKAHPEFRDDFEKALKNLRKSSATNSGGRRRTPTPAGGLRRSRSQSRSSARSGSNKSNKSNQSGNNRSRGRSPGQARSTAGRTSSAGSNRRKPKGSGKGGGKRGKRSSKHRVHFSNPPGKGKRQRREGQGCSSQLQWLLLPTEALTNTPSTQLVAG